MQDHQHTIGEVYNLADTLNSKAPKKHEHEEYAPKNHRHDTYAPTNHKHKGYATEDHRHDGYAAAEHTHSEFEDVAKKQHTHEEYAAADHTHSDLKQAISEKAPIKHKHSEYAAKDHKHEEYAAKEHAHESYAPANHNHNGYAAEQHTHPELQEAIAQVGRSQQCCFVLKEDSQMDIDSFEVGKAHQVICTNTEKIVRIYDYFKSAKPIRYNTQNIVIAPRKTFAATICRGKDVSYVLFNGVIV